jgi:hypothetical protein
MDCVQQNPEVADNTTFILQCVSDTYQSIQENNSKSLHSFLMVVSGALIFFMQTGFASM